MKSNINTNNSSDVEMAKHKNAISQSSSIYNLIR